MKPLVPKDTPREVEAKAAANKAMWAELKRIAKKQGAKKALERYLTPRRTSARAAE